MVVRYTGEIQREEGSTLKFIVEKVFNTPDSRVVAGNYLPLDVVKSECGCNRDVVIEGLYFWTGYVSSPGKLDLPGTIYKISSYSHESSRGIRDF